MIYPTISNVRRFYKAAVYAFVAHLQNTKAAPRPASSS